MSLPKVEVLRQQLVSMRDADYDGYKGYKETIAEFIDAIDTLIGALDDCEKKSMSRERARTTYALMTRLVINLGLEIMANEFIVPRHAKLILQEQRKEKNL